MSQLSTPRRVTGSCLCGRVRYAATGPFPAFRYCHCERCQKFTGSAHSSGLLVLKERLEWLEGEDQTTLFVHKEAEDYMRRFCRTCGGPVPKPARDGLHMIIPAGTLDVDPGERPQANIFWRLRAPWFVPTSELPTFDERVPK